MKLKYSYIRQIGGNEHRIEMYEGWSREDGLTGETELNFTSRHFSTLKAKLKDHLSPAQRALMSVRETGKCSHLVISEDGTTLECNL